MQLFLNAFQMGDYSKIVEHCKAYYSRFGFFIYVPNLPNMLDKLKKL